MEQKDVEGEEVCKQEITLQLRRAAWYKEWWARLRCCHNMRGNAPSPHRPTDREVYIFQR